MEVTMKPIIVYYVTQLLCTLSVFGVAVNYYKTNVLISGVLLLCALFEALKLWTDYNGDNAPEEYNKHQVVKNIVMIKGWFVVNLCIVYLVMVIYPHMGFLGLCMIMGLQYLSDVNIEFYKYN
jgi:hypothetical protein